MSVFNAEDTHTLRNLAVNIATLAGVTVFLIVFAILIT